MTPRNQRRLGVLVGISLLLSLLGAASAAGSPIEDKRAEAARLQRQLDEQGMRISQMDEQYNQALIRSESARGALAKAQADLAAANQRFSTVKTRMSQAAVSAYMHGGNTSMVEQLVKSDGRDLAVRKQYVETAASDQRSALEELRTARQDLEANQARMTEKANASKAAADKLAAQKRDIDKAVAAMQATLSNVKGDLADLMAQEQARQNAEAARRVQSDLAARAANPPRPSRGSPVKPVPTGPPPPVGSGASAAVSTARAQIGDPYVWGAAGPDSFDCSGLTQYAWRAGGVSLPHSSQMQYSGSTRVPISAIQPGDLLFFYSDLHHVAMYSGGGMMIEAARTGTNVREVPMRVSDLQGAGRVS